MIRCLLAVSLVAACGSPRPAASPTAVTPAATPPAATPPAAVAPHPDYPASRREPVVDRLHGVEVPDPYRWLEDVGKPEVKAWMQAQDQYARRHLAALPGRDAFATRLADLWYHDSITPPAVRNGRLFYTRRHKDKEKPITYWRQGEHGAEHVLLDPNAWSTDGSLGLKDWSSSWDGKRVAYSVSEHNADETVTHMIDVATGKVLPDALTGTRFSGLSWSPDGRGFYYTWTPPASEKLAEADRNAQSTLRYHKLGDDQAHDATVREATGHNDWFIAGQITQDGHWLLLAIEHGASGAGSWFFKDLRKPGAGWTTLIDGTESKSVVIEWRDRFYVHTNDGAPRFHILAVDPKTPARTAWKELVAEQGATLDAADVIGGHLVLSYLRNAASEIAVHSLDGKLVRKLDLPPLGSVERVVGLPGDDTAYLEYSSFTDYATVYKTSIASGKVDAWAHVTLPIDTSAFTAEQVHYRSKDGTDVSMFLVHRKDVVKGSNTPTLLTGYGGFQISLTPEFSIRNAVFVERGGLVAIPNLRGGGEYGEDWHRAGMLLHKQNVFDDFIAAARYLIDERWTSRDRLAILGGSNGGLLVGAAAVQAPELFKAVICAVPLLDMIRYHRFGLGAAWISEYGSADESSQFAALYAYSPYHAVHPYTAYPALLMLSSDHDDRVDPMHARKFVAAVQAATTSAAPIWLRIEQNAGHGGADVVKQQVDEWADALAFAASQLGM